MLAMSAVMKLLRLPAVVQGFAQYGLPTSQMVLIGILELSCAIIYAIPRTAVLGAILMTGYLGGATLTNVRVGSPQFVGPIILGVLVWAGLFFRDERIRALIPLRK
jgi:hypothetical protein